MSYDSYFIPTNFTDAGRVMGLFELRNLIEALILTLPALYLCLTGVVCILLSIWVNNIWKDESTLRDIVVYVLDIAATVPFWAAMEIYFIDNKERRRRLLDLKKRFAGIEFHSKA